MYCKKKINYEILNLKHFKEMKKIILLAIPIIALLMGACSKENDGVDDVNKESGEPAYVTISLLSSTTRATEPGSTPENNISSVEFYVFDSTGDPDTILGGGTGYHKVTSFTASPTILQVESGSNRKFVVIANSDIGEVTNYAELKAKLGQYTFTSGTINSPRVVPADGFEMSGEAVKTIVAHSTNVVYVNMKRTVSKFNAPNLSGVTINLTADDITEIWGSSTAITSSSQLSFSFDGYVLINGRSDTDLFFIGNAEEDDTDPIDIPWDNWSETGKININSTFDATGNYTSVYSGSNTTTGEFFMTAAEVPTIYVHENMPIGMIDDATGTIGWDPITVYSFIIQGTLTPDNGEAAVTRYWRVNLVYSGQDLHVRRNLVYKTSITALNSPGYGTPEEAENGGEIIPMEGDALVQVYLQILDWEIFDYSTEM